MSPSAELVQSVDVCVRGRGERQQNAEHQEVQSHANEIGTLTVNNPSTKRRAVGSSDVRRSEPVAAAPDGDYHLWGVGVFFQLQAEALDEGSQIATFAEVRCPPDLS